MKSSTLTCITSFFFISLWISIRLTGQVSECKLHDPLFDYEPEVDLCCAVQLSNTVCYNIGELGLPWTNIQSYGPFTFKALDYQSNGGGSWYVNEEFSTWEGLAIKMNNLQSYGSFQWDAGTQTLCAYNVTFEFGALKLCGGTIVQCNSSFAGGASPPWVSINPQVTVGDCPITEPEININDLADPNTPIPNANTPVFNGSGGTITVNDIVSGMGNNNDLPDGFPSTHNIGFLLGSLAGSGALHYGAGCENLNCMDAASLAQGLLNPEIASQLNENISGTPPSGNSWSEYLASEAENALTSILAGYNGSFTAMLNDVLGFQLPDMGPCPPGQMIPPGGSIPFPLQKEGDDKPGSNTKSLLPPNPETAADVDYFSQTIPGLGLEGSGVQTPMADALELIKNIGGGVDLYNGSQSSSISLYNLQSNDISIPVSLSSSNNGLKVNDLGSLAGQHWNLNAGGMISRVVKGLPDEFFGESNGFGVGRNYKIKPRFEIPANTGLRVSFPGDSQIPCPQPEQGIRTGFSENISLGESPFVQNAPMNLSVRWTPLQFNIVNFSIGIPVFEFFGIRVYLEFGFNYGVSLNEKLGNINYEETGLGFFYLDDANKMAQMGLDAINNPELFITLPDDDTRRKVLDKIHSNKWIEDTRFFNDQVANWNNWIQAVKEIIDGGYTYKTKKLDTEPDEFYFNFGKYSGKFSYNVNGDAPNAQPVLFPHYEGLKIEHQRTMDAQGNWHITSFTLTTPEGMEYTFGNSQAQPNFNYKELAGVDMTEDINYYLPNFYTYPEVQTGRQLFESAQIDQAQIVYNPFFGPKKIITFGNTYDRNYRIMHAPVYASTWHLIKVRSLLTHEVVSLDYQRRQVSYYSGKNYSHAFPNFNTTGQNLVTLPNAELNPLQILPTKWQNGRAEFSLSVTETNLVRWDIRRINAMPSRMEYVAFSYEDTEQPGDADRGEIYKDKLCSKITVYRNEKLYKGWELYYLRSYAEETSATCDETPLTNPAPPAISIGGEEKFSLGAAYHLNPFEYHRYFFINFSIGCLTIPVRIPFPFVVGVTDFGHRTHLYEYGSLMEVKALNNLYDVARETGMFNAEKKRSFLRAIKEIDREDARHPFVELIEYKSKMKNRIILPKRFSVHQDLFGHYLDNSLSGSPFPPVKYQSVFGNQVTNFSLGIQRQFGFYNLIAPGQMHLGHREYPSASPQDKAAQQEGALGAIHLATGGMIGYDYEQNILPGGQMGAGIRVSKMIESPGDSPARTTIYTYEGPTTVNEPVRIFQTPKDFYYKDYEQRVFATSGPQNPLFQNKNNHVGYTTVTESWDQTGSVVHHFSTPENFEEILNPGANTGILIDLTAWKSVKRASTWQPLCPVIPFSLLPVCEFSGPSSGILPPALEFPYNLSWQTWLLGVEYKTEVFNAEDAGSASLRQTTHTFYDFVNKSQDSHRYFKTNMYQYNFAGDFLSNYFSRLIPQFLPFYNDIDPLVNLIIGLMQGNILAHPFKYIERNYSVSDRRLTSSYLRVGLTKTVDIYSDNSSSAIEQKFTYAPDNPNPKTVTTYWLSDENGGIQDEVITTNVFANEQAPENALFEALPWLNSIGYHLPLFSRTTLNGTLFKQDFTALGLDAAGRVVPSSNWTLRNGQLSLAGIFSNYDANGRPQKYTLARFGAGMSSPPALFFNPFNLTWNNRLQLTSRSYEGFTASHIYDPDFFELRQSTDPDNVVSNLEYDSRGRLKTQQTLNGRQTTTFDYNIEPGNNFVTRTSVFGDAPAQASTDFVDGFGKPLKKVRDNDGAILEAFNYDAFFRTVATSHITTGLTLIEHEASPLSTVTTTTDAEGNITRTMRSSATEFFEATLVTDANGHTSSAHVDGLGRTRKTVSGAGSITRYLYDELSRPAQIIRLHLQQHGQGLAQKGARSG